MLANAAGAVMAAETGLQSAGARRKLGARPRQIAALLESSGLTSIVRRRAEKAEGSAAQGCVRGAEDRKSRDYCWHLGCILP